jgi:hypothetical protein
MISGGPAPPTSENLVQSYLPNQEKILPHEMPPERRPAITANVPAHAGTEAAEIQPALRTIRENVREAPPRDQGFRSDAAITYVHT